MFQESTQFIEKSYHDIPEVLQALKCGKVTHISKSETSCSRFILVKFELTWNSKVGKSLASK